ncbi:hypothetical protein DP44_5655 [Burkholderia pseudomallei]|nr:hypothetical protein DP44_5655 [Burkholderia pseudomallei]
MTLRALGRHGARIEAHLLMPVEPLRCGGSPGSGVRRPLDWSTPI